MMENKRYHIVIGSLIFAALAWISVSLREEYTVVKHFPVVLENINPGKALKYYFPKTVNVKFTSSGWILASLYLMPDPVFSVDLSTLGTEDFCITAKDLPEHMKLPASLHPVEVNPDSMVIALDDYREKRVPVTLNVDAFFKSGFGQVGSIRVSPESTTVGGAANLIGSITSWPTAFRKYEDLTGSVSVDLPLEEPNTISVKLLHNSVHLNIDVQPFAEKIFAGVPVSTVSLPMNREVIFIPPKMDVIARGGIDQLAKLSMNDFRATVDFQDLVSDTTQYVVPLLTAPSEIKVISKKPERFQYIIRKKL